MLQILVLVWTSDHSTHTLIGLPPAMLLSRCGGAQLWRATPCLVPTGILRLMAHEHRARDPAIPRNRSAAGIARRWLSSSPPGASTETTARFACTLAMSTDAFPVTVPTPVVDR